MIFFSSIHCTLVKSIIFPRHHPEEKLQMFLGYNGDELTNRGGIRACILSQPHLGLLSLFSSFIYVPIFILINIIIVHISGVL